MNTKGIKFLAVLAVLAMAFAAFAVVNTTETDDAAQTVEVGGLTFYFDAVEYFGGFDAAQTQDLTAEVSGTTIVLKGAIKKIDGTNADFLEDELGYDVAPAYGVAFLVTGFADGTKVKLNNPWWDEVEYGTESFFQAFSSPRTAESVKAFTLSVDSNNDGTADRTITIDFSNLVQYKVGDNYYFELDAAQAAGEAIVLNQNATIIVDDVEVGKTLTIPTGKTLTVKQCLGVLGDLVIDNGGNLVLEQGGDILDTGTVTNNGTISYADPSQILVGVAGTGAVKVGGNTVNIDVTDVDTAITAADFAAGKDVLVATGAIPSAVVPEGKTIVIVDASAISSIDISKNGAVASIVYMSGAGSDITITTDKTAVISGDTTGTFTFKKGSVDVNVSYWSDGGITIAKDSVLKIAGDGIDGAPTISVAEGTAKMIIEAGKTLDIGDADLVVGAGISVEVYGSIVGEGSITFNDNVKVANGGAIKVDNIAIAKTITAEAGSLVAGTVDLSSGKLVAYSGSNINGVGSLNPKNISGKDASTGTWTFDGATLTLNNYNGTYNFAAFNDEITAIELVGDNSITYAADPDFYFGNVLFGDGSNDLSIEPTVGAASLSIDVDLSALPGIGLATGWIVFEYGEIAVDQVTLSVTVKGTNNSWTDAQKSASDITAIAAENLDLNSSSLTVEIAPAFSGEEVAGIVTMSAGTKLVSSDLTVSSKGLALILEDIELKNLGSQLTVYGDAKIKTGMKVSNYAIVEINGVLEVSNFDSKLYANVTLKDVLFDGINTNNAFLDITGDSVLVLGSTFDNKDIINNDGKMTVLGAFTNNGSIVNSGDIVIPNYVVNPDQTGKSIAIKMPASIGETSLMVGSIVFSTYDESTINELGTANIADATVNFYKTGDTDGAPSVAVAGYIGTLTPAVDGKGYVLVLENADSKITVTYDAKKAGTTPSLTSKDYIISVSGTAKDSTTTKNIVSNTADLAVTDTVKNVGATEYFVLSNASFTVAENANIASSGTFTVASGDEIVAAKGEFFGNISAAVPITIAGSVAGDIDSIAAVTVSGAVEGDIAAQGLVTISGTVFGDIATTGAVDVSGKLEGSILADGAIEISTAKATVTGNIASMDAVTIVGTLEGDVLITKNGSSVTFADGLMVGEITYVYEYAATKGSETKTIGTATMEVFGKGTYTLNLKAPVDSDSTNDGIAGYFEIPSNPTVPANELLDLTLTSGKMLVDTSLTLPVGTTLAINDGTEFEISLGQFLDVKTAALMVSDGATTEMSLETEAVPEYGIVKFEMNFTTSDGYTVYSDVASALELCDEGSVLNVGSTSTISKNVEVKNGVEIVVNNVTLTFAGKDVVMGDGAKFTIQGSGSIIFNATGDDGKATPTYYYVNANIEYDGNIITLDDVRFTADGNTFAGIEATDAEPSKISATLRYITGVVTVTAGNASSTSIVLESGAIADELVAAELCIADGACLETSSLMDAPQKAYKDGSSVVTTQYATCVEVAGTLLALEDLTITGDYIVDGDIVLAANKKVTIAGGLATPVATTAPGDIISPAFDGIIVDLAEIENGYEFSNVVPGDAATIVIQSVKDATNEYVSISGTVGSGSIVALTTAELNGLNINKKASLTADSVEILVNSDATGALVTKELTAKAGQKLTYDTTYEDAGYTVYTKFASLSADQLTKIGSVVIEADEFPLAGNIAGNVTITIKEGNVAIVGAKAIVGTAPTSLGAGTVLIGKISVAAGAYLLVYPTADISGATIVGADKTTAAAMSAFDIDGTLYATAYANADNVLLNGPAADLKPAIPGYTFTAWSTYNTKDLGAAFVGETNVTGAIVAGKVTVTATYAAGVAYYLNGVEFGYTDIPYKVSVGDVFTAKIVDYSKYQGTPLVNGKTSYIVSEDATLTISGVAPIPAPEPTPEPEKDDNGITLTEILLIVLIVLCAVMVIVVILRLNRS